MSLLPKKLMSINDAAALVAQHQHLGRPDAIEVKKVRSLGVETDSHAELSEARKQLREWIVSGHLDVHAVGGIHGLDLVITPLEFQSIPLLKTLAVADLTFLRPSHPLHRLYFDRFGPDLALVGIGIERAQLQRLVRTRTLRSRRRATSERSRGRPNVLPKVEPAIIAIVNAGKWSAEKSQKELTRSVNRMLDVPVHQSTVTRALDALTHAPRIAD
jgi:hypothetical protein